MKIKRTEVMRTIISKTGFITQNQESRMSEVLPEILATGGSINKLNESLAKDIKSTDITINGGVVLDSANANPIARIHLTNVLTKEQKTDLLKVSAEVNQVLLSAMDFIKIDSMQGKLSASVLIQIIKSQSERSNLTAAVIPNTRANRYATIHLGGIILSHGIDNILVRFEKANG